MKISNLSKLVGVSVFAASVAVLPFNLPASAQTNSDRNTTTDTTTAPRQGTYDTNTNRDDGFDWGWLGLLGLAGLAGLGGRKRSEPDNARYRTEDEVRTTNFR
jgi:hypothetical protein